MPDQITDPAREIGALIDRIRAFDATTSPQQSTPNNWQVLSKGLGVRANTAEFLEMLAAVRSRLARLDEFIVGMSDPTVGDDVIRHMREAIGRFSGTFNPAYCSRIGWSKPTQRPSECSVRR